MTKIHPPFLCDRAFHILVNLRQLIWAFSPLRFASFPDTNLAKTGYFTAQPSWRGLRDNRQFSVISLPFTTRYKYLGWWCVVQNVAQNAALERLSGTNLFTFQACLTRNISRQKEFLKAKFCSWGLIQIFPNGHPPYLERSKFI